MKNVVLFIVDSMNYSHMKKYPFLTPFLNQLKENGLSFENMYSQAPYTEAATMNVYCGQNVLDNGGYIRRFKDAKKTIFEAFKEKGYTTYYNYFQPQCYPSSLRRGIDFPFYDVGFDLGALWAYRLYMYSDLLSKNEITSKYYELLIDILNDNFAEWILFVENLISKNDTIGIIQNNSLSFNSETVLHQVLNEYESFKNNEIDYINKLLTEKKEHKLFQIQAFVQDNKIKDKKFIKEFQEKYRGFFDELNIKNQKLNRRNCKGAFVGTYKKLFDFVKCPTKNNFKNFGKSLILSMNVYKDADLFDRISSDYETFKNAPSVKTHIDHYINWEKNRKKDKPSFSCIHIDDIHNPEMFFTYDSCDMGLIDMEFADARSVLEQLPNDYYGNITHDLSLRYIDTKLKYFYEQLREIGALDDTIVMICADHGFSFSGNPLRDSFVINMFLENYNIPCIISGTEETGVCDKLCSSKDIPTLLTYLADGKIPEEFCGKNILCDEQIYEHLFIEYCGGGCPDLNRRLLKIGCFDKNYFVATESLLEEEITIKDVFEIYDLQKDPLQKVNIVKNKNKIDIEKYINYINDRKVQIQAMSTHYE